MYFVYSLMYIRLHELWNPASQAHFKIKDITIAWPTSVQLSNTIHHCTLEYAASCAHISPQQDLDLMFFHQLISPKWSKWVCARLGHTPRCGHLNDVSQGERNFSTRFWNTWAKSEPPAGAEPCWCPCLRSEVTVARKISGPPPASKDVI